jgi:hypothetical protein
MDVVAARRIESGHNNVLTLSDVQGSPPPAGALRIDQWVDFGPDVLVLERRHQEIALPAAIGLSPPMLDLAPAAVAKMRAERRDAFRTRDEDFAQLRMSARDIGLDHLAGQAICHIDGVAAGLADSLAMAAHFLERKSRQPALSG